MRYTTEYRYDLMGNMTGIRYPNSEAWLDYEYDKMGRVIAVPGFAGTRSNPGLAYDENGAFAAVRMENEITTTYNRDRNERVTGIIATGLSGEDILNLSLGYDAANNITSRNDNTYVYDKVNRLLRANVHGNFEDKFTKADMILGTADFDYFGAKEIEEEVTDHTRVKLDFAARSLILNLQTEAENICRIELTPEQTGHRVPVDQIRIFYKQNEHFTVLEEERWTAVKDDQGRIIITFDPYLTVTELKIHCNFDDLDYWQQPVDRSEFYNFPENLVTVYQKVKYRTESYEYDAMGNRTVERHLLRKEYAYYYEYYAKSNRLKTNGRFAYEYDANGNLIRKGNRYQINGETIEFVTSGGGVKYWEYYYDLFNRLEEVKKNGETVARYLYDPNGFRVEKFSSKGKVHYVQLLNGEVGYRKEITVNKEYSFIYFAGLHLARVDGVIGGPGKKYFYHNDHLGSALAVTDEEGNKVIERDFLPFGEMINLQEGPNPYADGSGFTGKDWDEEIGLYYFNARWYDPEIGRFISQDPVADDPNLYSYGYNNPLKFVDSSGYWNVSINWSSFLKTSISYISPEAAIILRDWSTFRGFVSTIDDIQWTRFLYFYTRMDKQGFQYYLRSKEIYYHFTENNTSNYVFTNTEGQRALKQSMFASVLQKALIGDQKLSYFHAIEDNIEAFLKNNPGLSFEQVKGIFDSAVISADNEWGFGKNEFRYEGRGANYAGLYDAEAIVMNEGMVLSLFGPGDAGKFTIIR